MKTYEGLAHAFLAEGVEAHFCLVGDANMHWTLALDRLPGVRTFHARHEHCAVAMAAGYASATGKVGVASVTCGPGFTQIMTALACAARDNLPVVVFAGESPLNAKWYIQQIDQRPLAVATGADYIAAHSPALMHHYVQEAFLVARQQRKPVVIGVPYDLQHLDMPSLGAYQTSDEILPVLAPLPPDPTQIEFIAELLAGAERPLLIAGRGALAAHAEDDIRRLASVSGALLGTTLPGRGAFDDDPFSLGVIGGFARKVGKEFAQKADVVIGFGASLSYFFQSGGRLMADATIVQIDVNPVGRHNGLKVADHYLKADAKLAARALLERLGNGSMVSAKVRTAELAQRIKDEPADDGIFPEKPDTVDPRALFKKLEQLIPRDFDAISGSGHQAYFHAGMRGYDPRKYHILRDFGAIGNALSYGIGIAAARHNSGKVVIYEGDGGLLMNIQELECIKRHRIKLLVVVCNDGAYGSEIHTLRREGLDDSIAVFGRPDLKAIAGGFGLRGETVTDVSQLDDLARAYEQGDTATIWDVHVNDLVVSPTARGGMKPGA